MFRIYISCPAIFWDSTFFKKIAKVRTTPFQQDFLGVGRKSKKCVELDQWVCLQSVGLDLVANHSWKAVMR